MKTNKVKAVFKSAGSLAWFIVSTFLVILLVVLTVLENTMLEPILQTVLGDKKPVFGKNTLSIYAHESEYKTKKDATEAGNALNVQIAEEGFVLLLNEETDGKAALPMKDEKKVSVFGHNSVDLVLGGTGSGGISGENSTTIYDSLKNNGFEFNPELKKFYESSAAGGKRTTTALADSTSESPTLDIGETPVANYTSAVKSSFKNYNDAAIVVLSRVGGESFDVPRTQSKNGGVAGRHYLQLDKNEEDMLKMVTSRFDKVIVLLNTLQAFQCDFVNQFNNVEGDPRIDALMWIGGPGTTGAEAIGEILRGTVNPSGRTVDIYPADFTKDPTWQNFGDSSQVSVDGKSNTAFVEGNAELSGYNMLTYDEGIYLGYRYYETRGAVEAKAGNSSWYEDNVMFPFGYGLSYTKFRQTIVSNTGSLDGKGQVTISVEVENIGSVEGKDVVELYVTKPYTEGGIEKSHVELVDFAKTKSLAAGAKQTITFKVNAYDLASYDYNNANKDADGFKGYELEKGDYIFYASRNSHVTENAYASCTFTVTEGMTWATVDGREVKNRYTDTESIYDSLDYRLDSNFIEAAGENRKGMSRTDFAETFPRPLTKEERTLLDGAEKTTLQDKTPNNPLALTAEMPKTGASTDLKLRDLVTDKSTRTDASKGFLLAQYETAEFNAILDSLTYEDMITLVNYGAFKTSAIESIGKNLTNDSDGPIGFVNFMPGMSSHYKGNVTFACEIVIGSTWNKDLAYRMGQTVGENGLFGDENGNALPYTGWYAPAVNLHRSPFSGRNFEYYSEDPVLTGKLAVNVINGAKTKGVYSDLKHFALNDQETNRSGVSTFCTEQALRELYLKPFEIAVKANDDPIYSEKATQDGWTKYEGTTGIMSSFNRIGNKWTGGDYRLCTEILRNEWGFRGLVICDYKTDNFFMDAKQMVYAGNDLILASLTDLMWQNADSTSAADMYVLRTATHNILYATVNSNAIQQEITGYKMEWWKSLTIAVDVIVPVALAVWGYFAITKALKKAEGAGEEAVAEQPATDGE